MNLKLFFISIAWSFFWAFLIAYAFGCFVNLDMNPTHWSTWFRVVIFIIATIWALAIHYHGLQADEAEEERKKNFNQ
jgi:hypothetical protein